MRDKVLAVLKKLGIDEYIINETQTRSAEMFFIKKTLDMKRIKDAREMCVTVFRPFESDGKKMKGSSQFHVYDQMTEEEIEKAVKSAYLAASYVCNPDYALQEMQKNEFVEMKSNLTGHTLEESAKIMAEALFAEDTDEKVFINSAELFVTENTVKIYSSTGVDAGYRKYKVAGEFVAQCKEPQDVETYQNFRYDGLEAESLRKKVRRVLEITLDRARAKIAPKAGKYRVIISDSYMKEIFSYYVDRADAAYIYGEYSGYKIGDDVQARSEDGSAAQIKGDRITLDLVAETPYSDEGTLMVDRKLMEAGVLKTYHGSVRFSRYIGSEPTGDYRSIRVEKGSRSVEELKKEPYLHVVNFSDFQMDSFTGHFGGEIRLAYLYDGEKVTPVTGGSINGDIIELQANMFFSEDTQVEDGYSGPLAVCFEGVPVAGA